LELRFYGLLCQKPGLTGDADFDGAEVTELIQGFTIAKTLETTESELMESIFPHPVTNELGFHYFALLPQQTEFVVSGYR
jgi:hypothetical protein